MRPLSDLPPETARSLRGVIFDLDDTLLDHGALTEAAYTSLFILARSGLRLIACTGRPAGFGQVITRQWPIDAAITENGAISFVREGSAPDDRVIKLGDEAAASLAARRGRLLALAEELVDRYPDAALADDNNLRLTDVTIDVGEHRRVSPEDARSMRAIAAERGVRTLQSSVHLHLTFETADKATGTIGLLSRRFKEDATAARARYAFIGDSGNDAAAFAAFLVTFGVANVRAHLAKLPIPPRYVTVEPMGRGFLSIARALSAERAP